MTWWLALCVLALVLAIGVLAGAHLVARLMHRAFDIPPRSDL